MIKAKDELLGVRITGKLKKVLDQYCKSTGVSRKHFVEQAIRERLKQILQDAGDVAEAERRLATLDPISEEEMREFFKDVQGD